MNDKEKIKLGELMMQDLWSELGYRIAEEKETYKILGNWLIEQRCEVKREILHIHLCQKCRIKYLEEMKVKK